MSLNVYLYIEGVVHVADSIPVRVDGGISELSRAQWDELYPGIEPVVIPGHETSCVYSDNITHNLNYMAREAGIYMELWRPEEIGIELAGQLVKPLMAGYFLLNTEPDRFRKFNPENGWGTYEVLVEFVKGYLAACAAYPEATVRVSR